MSGLTSLLAYGNEILIIIKLQQGFPGGPVVKTELPLQRVWPKKEIKFHIKKITLPFKPKMLTGPSSSI